MNTSLQVIEKYLDELQWISEHPVAENNVPAIVKDLRNIVLYEIASEHEVGMSLFFSILTISLFYLQPNNLHFSQTSTNSLKFGVNVELIV
jgi:hypothetical protein